MIVHKLAWPFCIWPSHLWHFVSCMLIIYCLFWRIYCSPFPMERIWRVFIIWVVNCSQLALLRSRVVVGSGVKSRPWLGCGQDSSSEIHIPIRELGNADFPRFEGNLEVSLGRPKSSSFLSLTASHSEIPLLPLTWGAVTFLDVEGTLGEF